MTVFRHIRFGPRRAGLAGLAAVLALAVAVPTSPALAVGGDDELGDLAPSAKAQYENAKREVDRGRYARAIPMLERVVKAEPANANAHNLLAFSHRKLGRYDKALALYRTALALDPRHRGAHEYLGELYLAKGDLASAEQMRARLAGLCGGACEELADLDRAIAAFKAGRATN